jgi:hypothetical protein
MTARIETVEPSDDRPTGRTGTDPTDVTEPPDER